MTNDEPTLNNAFPKTIINSAVISRWEKEQILFMKDWNKNEIFRISKADFKLGKVSESIKVDELKFSDPLEVVKKDKKDVCELFCIDDECSTKKSFRLILRNVYTDL